jgi:hypothetical protein
VSNLVQLYAAMKDIDTDAAVKQFHGLQTSHLKDALATTISDAFDPIHVCIHSPAFISL